MASTASIGNRAALALVVVLAAAPGCGDDDPPPAAAPVAPKPTAAASSGAAGAKNTTKLPEKLHIEERVACPVPDKPSDPKDGKCDPKAPSCAEHTYCLQLAQGFYCEACPERDGIRHTFKDRDFVVEQNRDPFQSFLLQPLFRNNTDTVQIDVTRKCVREDQMVATSNSYTELKLVGIVAQGTQRKVLMVNGREGWIIKRGDCVGKEKAVVKDIGTGYITFLVDADTAAANQRPAEEFSVQLNPKQLSLNEPTDLPQPAPRTTIAPVIPPPAVVPGARPNAPGAAPAPAPAGTAPPAVPAGTAPATAPGASPAGVAPATPNAPAVPAAGSAVPAQPRGAAIIIPPVEQPAAKR
ncbi:MAG TPA: hypothetical protein VLM79_08950 [Kofleriaceae bacterium]|nr:hypothetical protein [Kofleriaceae bacterium]